MKGKEIGNFFVDKGMCFPASAQVVDTIWANDVYSFSIPDYIPIKHLKITEQIGGKNAYAKILIDIAQCQAVILENESRPVPSAVNSKIFVVDVESNRVLSETPLNFLGDYQLISNLGLLLVDEKRGTAVGTTQGVKWDKSGKVHVFDLKTKEEKWVAIVPEGGKHMWISPDGKTLFYFGSRRLTILDLVHFKTLGTIEVPFTDAEIGFIQGQ